MDDDQQGAWWTKPPSPPTPTRPLRPPTARATGGSAGGTSSSPAAPQGPADGDLDDGVVDRFADRREEPIGRAGPPEDPIEIYDRAPHRPHPGPVSGLSTHPDPPTRPMEYLTVRLDPDSPANGLRPISGDTMEVPAAAMPRLRQGPPSEPRPAPTVQRGPVILLAAGVLLVIVTVAVIASRVATGAGPRTTLGPATSATPAPAVFSGTPPRNLEQVNRAKATQLLARAHRSAGGTIKRAFTWTDGNGMNLLVTASNRTSAGTSLRVTQLARLDGKPQVLRVMIEPDLPECSGDDPKAGFTAGSMFVRDLDGDGVAEATVGWSSRCGSGPSVAKLALLSDGQKYIIRGEGDVGNAGSGSGVPDPVAARWPAKFLGPLTTLYRSLYF
ncbi:M949_RS01915 family surface polysaccharide biosynthesis protein [Spongisporangium articulatum]|uniref:M949_RS01915 family surface polysaccharide biosynthesis protein n=1 Tax=Spongisporangium articulatum TaxID=3362603 RepID=A0ABW8AHW1_9ACTN